MKVLLFNSRKTENKAYYIGIQSLELCRLLPLGDFVGRRLLDT